MQNLYWHASYERSVSLKTLRKDKKNYLALLSGNPSDGHYKARNKIEFTCLKSLHVQVHEWIRYEWVWLIF